MIQVETIKLERAVEHQSIFPTSLFDNKILNLAGRLWDPPPSHTPYQRVSGSPGCRSQLALGPSSVCTRFPRAMATRYGLRRITVDCWVL